MSKRATGTGAKGKATRTIVQKALSKQVLSKPAAKTAAAAKGKSKPAVQASPRAAKSVAKTASSKVAYKALPQDRARSAVVKTAAASKIVIGETNKQRPMTRAADKAPDKKLTARAPQSSIVLTPDYRPSEDEPFMNEMHRMYFRQKLLTWKEEIIRQTRETLAGLHEDSTQHADLADRATSETDRALELRARDRQRKLIAKIDAALARIEDGSYGYCEETGEPIGLKRLDARPIATLSVEAQERHERRERVYRED
jgi:DnaK suppressor protein